MQPLKKVQNITGSHVVKGDFIGHSFLLEQDVSSSCYGRYLLSGIEWEVRSKLPLSAGTEVEITRVEAGLLAVAAKPWGQASIRHGWAAPT